MKGSLKKYFRNLAIFKNLLILKKFFFPPVRIWGNSALNFTSSDSFYWRTDDNFSTIFRYSDIANKYYDTDSSILIIFFDRFGSFQNNLPCSIFFQYTILFIILFQ